MPRTQAILTPARAKSDTTDQKNKDLSLMQFNSSYNDNTAKSVVDVDLKSRIQRRKHWT